ncbi:hypothetical protein N7456_005618 [Penicillium angulare]|uniref:S-adenosyl-L-methionine-dependent methyltransferase n=1 Tax=Penicillium angulare TaxID=116970 RepID=A0A9W9KKP4_9EURO|nr:hypothetical protein N7456_005618 [Penicillium angulare]
MAQESSQETSRGGRLLNTFADRPVQDHGSGWSNLWDAGESNLWDRGKASPALVDLVEGAGELFDPFTIQGTKKNVLVPGCGRGYDVVMLALHGFNAYGLEISDTAVKAAEAYAASQMSHPSAYHFGNEQSRSSSPGTVTFLKGDFFSPTWDFKGEPNGIRKFDMAYDYTFLCAIDPSQRRNWAKSMGQIIKPGGLLICLEFPLYKDPKLPGPPWGLNGVHWNLLVEGKDGEIRGENIGDDGKEMNSSQTDDGDFRRISYMKPTRSYEQGRGTDMLSMYIRK